MEPRLAVLSDNIKDNSEAMFLNENWDKDVSIIKWKSLNLITDVNQKSCSDTPTLVRQLESKPPRTKRGSNQGAKRV